ncbi:centromere protein F-like [Denticeps clupeoides]|uniref:centromere protein F-like n=1 Tax=Denticeps clupeoides TaxID=299321 RepID=UPI0010A3A39B|nr:centromere protein F-like [Denticeps clupeoides]
MSWAAEDWTSGLSGPVLQKVQELQRQQERLGRERQQRQLQLDNADAALNKQRVKNEELRAKLVAVQREMAAVQDVAQSESRARERLAQELQVKQAQVCSLEGQVESARTQMNTLMQQVKRLEQELEKLQSGNVSGDSMLFSTPCWNMASPWENSDCSTDDKKMTRGGRESRMLPVRQQLQFDNFSPKPTGPQHSRQTSPPHQSAHQADAFTPSSVFPWERNDKLDLRRREASQPCVSNVVSRDQPTEGFGTEEGLKKERDALKSANRTLQTRVQTLEKDVQAESERFRDVEGRLSDVRRELASRDQSLNRTRDELGRANTSLSQERDRLQLSDQRVKQLQEELKCQRQNAESSRCTAEQRRREMEREHQREVQELQKERQAVDRLHQQESFKLNQEIQQARTQYNTLQSQFDKLSLQKQALERDLENLNQKLRNTESQLQDSQKRDAQTQSKLMEALRERDGLAVTVEQLKRKEKSWQEEIKRLEEELAEALKLLKELQERGPVPLPSAPLEFMLTGSLQHNHQISHQQSVQKKRPIKSDRLKEDNVLPKFPSDREPGEGMDSENITEQTFFSSEETLKTKGRGPKLRVDEVGIAVDSKSAPPDEDPVSHVVQVVGKQENKECVIEDEDRNPSTTVKPCSSDLERENSVLVDELRDMKLELQRRLDDLEAQRRSEAEARTKLKQLSRKYASQSEQLRQKAQEQQKLLEEEKLETGRLKESLDALDKDRQNKEEEKMELNRLKENMEEMERKEREMEEHRNQLMESLEALKVEMTQEREKGMEEEQEEKKNLVARVTDLEAQLEELQSRLKENVSLNCEERKARVPTLCEEIFVPVKRIGFCQAENILNATVSQEHTVRDLITDFETAECKEPSGPYLKDSTGSGVQQELEILKELCETLQNERDVEASKAKSFQNRLDVLQKQVTSQTQQLTQAFESQSCHIEGLLHELNERDHLLQRQGEELHLCREKIAQLEAKNLQEDKRGNDGSANAEVSSQESDQSKKSVLHEDLTSANLLQDEVTISTNANAEDLLLDGTIQAEQAALKINASCNLTEDVRAYETVPADLCELKIQNDQLFKEMQSVIRENEDLRWRLKWLETQDPNCQRW